jgi:LPXTG-motif cell wall-anchored protein
MARTLKIATLLALVFCVGTVAVAQTTTEIVHKSGTVLGKYDGKVVVQMDDGSVKEFTPAAGKTVMVDGVPTTYETLKIGTVLSADFVKTTTTVPVKTTQIKNGTVSKVVGNTLIYRDAKGYKSVDVPAGFKFLVDGKETTVAGLRPNTKLTATIVHTSSKEVSESEIANLGGVAPAAPAPAPAPAMAPPPAPAPAPAPEPAPAPALPKTGSPLPLAALGGALSLLAGLGVRSFRRSR